MTYQLVPTTLEEAQKRGAAYVDNVNQRRFTIPAETIKRLGMIPEADVARSIAKQLFGDAI